MFDLQQYNDFLRAKVPPSERTGFDITAADVNQALKPHQKACVEWMVRGGRRALFAAFGLGKSIMQMEAVRLTLAVSEKERGLIVIPLGVRQEFQRDAETKEGGVKA